MSSDDGARSRLQQRRVPRIGAALLDRKTGHESKTSWAVGSALFGLVCVPALFVFVTLIAGP
jgi:hypothetical protein